MEKFDFISQKFITPSITKKLVLLLVFSLASVAIFYSRVYVTGSYRFFFLNWNLLLAWVPVLLLVLKDTIIVRKEIKYLALFLAFLFLPNSFYVLTDFIHAQPTGQIGLWFDVILISFYALSSLLIGYVLIESVWRVILKRIGVAKSVVIISILFMIMAFGVYLGRFLRLNSWDILYPLNLFDDIFTGFASLFGVVRAVVFTFLYGFLLEIIFFVFKSDEV